MARTNYGLEKGISIYAENGDVRVMLLQGTAAPDGTSGDQSAAPIGSLYIRSGTGELYQKVANAGAPADYSKIESATLGNWRPERVDAHTGQTLAVGNTDPTSWSDNDDGTDHTAFTVGHYVLDGNCALFEITAISAPNLTLAAAASAPATDDMFAVKYNMPDPAGQENQAIITYNGSACIKVADVDFGSATAISLVAPYTAASGDPAASDSVQDAIEKLDGNNDAQDSLIGTAQGATDLGTFSGTTIPDSATVKSALQAVETAHEETDQNVDDLITLSGVAENSTDLGTFTGDIITDNTTVKPALQELETELVDTRDNADDLITLSGVAENSTDHGTMDQGDILSDASTTNALLKETDAELTRQRGKSSAAAVTTSTVIDSIDVNTVAAANWLITIEDVATQKSAHIRVFAGHDGSSDGVTDATAADNTLGKILKIGGSFNYSVTVDLNGTGAGQTMRLSVASTEGSGVNVFAKREEVLF